LKFAAEIVDSLASIDRNHWNALGEADYPFTRYEFLRALEDNQCLEEFGWQPVYFLLSENSIPRAAIASYIKHNSYGELVFDHSWAQAYERSGQAYYPKLVSAIPYTPATGPRFLIHRDFVDESLQQAMRDDLLHLIQRFCIEHKLSGWHLLFPREELAKSLNSEVPLLFRYDCQFHWENHDYHSFDDFLGALSSRKRKNIRKERASVAAENLLIEQKHGAELSDAEWTRVYQLYAGIFHRKYGTPTLSEGFFRDTGQALDRRMLVVLVRAAQQIIAASVFFVSDTTLYGRVWGCDEYYNHLHFECCYYQGIDYCIANGLKRFDPGAQGEHKISRGFLPTRTCSAHWMVNQDFHEMIRHYLDQEEQYINDYCATLLQRSPYRHPED
jgi:predicted N-acyltransferase